MKAPVSTCGCCEGVEQLTPASLANRPGLRALTYRAGTYSTFFESMVARLSNLGIDLPTGEFDAEGKAKTRPIFPLADLTTRDPSDPAIALLDGWATVADVLTFYDERIANEGYLRTATERRSVLDLARLIGYAPRPGVSATAYLAYTIDEDRSVTPPKSMEVTIPAGSRAQSTPGPNELPQTFETSDPLPARTAWNKLQPRLSRPQTAESIALNGLYLKGTALNLKANDPIVIAFGSSQGTRVALRVAEVTTDTQADRTHVLLRSWSGAKSAEAQLLGIFKIEKAAPNERKIEQNFLGFLGKGPSLPPANATRLPRSLSTTLGHGGDVFPRLLTTFQPRFDSVLIPAVSNASIAPSADISIYALRVSASLFGHNIPSRPHFNAKGEISFTDDPNINAWEDLPEGLKPLTTINLDTQYDQIKPLGLALLDRPELKGGGRTQTFHTIDDVQTASMSMLNVSSKVTQLTLRKPWLEDVTEGDRRSLFASTPFLRGTLVYAQDELLTLAEVPIAEPVCESEIELANFYDDLQTGRWVILSGERAGVLDTNGQEVKGIHVNELAMILSVAHRTATTAAGEGKSVSLPGDKTHTFIELSTKPAYCYVRETMTIYGNVVKATHGESRKEVLGSGDASKPMQSFTLKQPPLTFLPAPTAAGAASTLVVRVNEVEWHETDTLAGLLPNDRNFITKTDDEAKTTVVFGNGRKGARPPSGANNITAAYRNGIGQPGNAKAGQINQLATRPLGVKEVINPLPATGGADREDRDQARENAPLGILALDRLVSVQDYADFSRTFAGIGKASAQKLSDSAREIVYVTIAGANDIPIDQNSDLYRNLVQALHSLGDPHLPIAVELREMLSLVLSAKVHVRPDYAWEFVEPKVRAALLEAFSFARRDLAQDVTRSEVISVIQAVRGVSYVDLDLLATISESEAEAELNRTIKGENRDDAKGFGDTLTDVGHRVVVQSARVNTEVQKFSVRLSPAQIAVLSSALPETLVLTEAKE